MVNSSPWTADHPNPAIWGHQEAQTLTHRVGRGGVCLRPAAAHLSRRGHQTHTPATHEHQPGMPPRVHPTLTWIVAHQHGMHHLEHQIRMRMAGARQRGLLVRGRQTRMRRARTQARSARVWALDGVVQLLEGMCPPGGRRLGGRPGLLVILRVIGVPVRGSRVRIRVLGEMLTVGGVVLLQPQLPQTGIAEEVG